MPEPLTLQLDEGVSVVLGAAGSGSVRIGPTRAGQKWRVTSTGVTVSTNTNEPTARIYLGTPAPSNFLGGSASGSNDSAQCDVTLFRGQYLTCEWSGGDVGARATLSVYGEVQVG